LSGHLAGHLGILFQNFFKNLKNLILKIFENFENFEKIKILKFFKKIFQNFVIFKSLLESFFLISISCSPLIYLPIIAVFGLKIAVLVAIKNRFETLYQKKFFTCFRKSWL